VTSWTLPRNSSENPLSLRQIRRWRAEVADTDKKHYYFTYLTKNQSNQVTPQLSNVTKQIIEQRKEWLPFTRVYKAKKRAECDFHKETFNNSLIYTPQTMTFF
jgi:hypothetical protein